MTFNQIYNNSLTDELHGPLTDYEISGPQNQLNTRPYNWGQNASNLVSHTHARISAPAQDIEAILQSASHFALMAAGNEAHMRLYEDYMRVKYQLEAQKDRVSELKDELKEVQNIALVAAKSKKLPEYEELPRRRSSVEFSIEIPPAPPTVEQDDFPDVRYWAKTDWIEYCKRARLRNEVPDKFGFLCDESGEKVSSQRLEEMSKSATTAWNDLYYWRLDPETWAKKIDQATKYFNYTMAQKYPEFRWCHGDWKMQEFATHRYPGWNRYHRQSGQLKRRIPSIVKRKVEDDNDSASAPKMKKRRLGKKQALAPPPDHNIIELNSEVEFLAPQSSSSATSPPPDNLNIASASTTSITTASMTADSTMQSTCSPGPSESPTTISASSSDPPSLVIATPISKPITTSLSPTIMAATEDMRSTCSPGPSTTGPSPATALAPSSSSPTLVLATSAPITTSSGPAITTVTSNMMNTSTLEATTTAASTADSDSDTSHLVTLAATTTTSTVLGEKGAQAMQSLRRRALVDPLAGLSIPAPLNEVPQTNTQPTLAPGPSKVPTKPKKSKVLEPSKTLMTARNLYAIFYKETHPEVTEADFREIYKRLDKETIKKYEAQSKQMKAAAGKTATAAAQGGNSGDT